MHRDDALPRVDTHRRQHELLDLLFHDGPLSREQKDRLCILAANEQLLTAVGDEVFKPDVPTAYRLATLNGLVQDLAPARRTTRAQREHKI
jgi:hypothetical protein